VNAHVSAGCQAMKSEFEIQHAKRQNFKNLKVKMPMPIKSAGLSKRAQRAHLRPLDYHHRRRVSQILCLLLTLSPELINTIWIDLI
jgi:hypothetical protein